MKWLVTLKFVSKKHGGLFVAISGKKKMPECYAINLVSLFMVCCT